MAVVFFESTHINSDVTSEKYHLQDLTRVQTVLASAFQECPKRNNIWSAGLKGHEVSYQVLLGDLKHMFTSIPKSDDLLTSK